jgi:hypothetical protein
MNKSTALRSEEARRDAQAAMLKAKQRQSDLLQERATMFASETKKVENLRALRLAKLESGDATVAPAPVAKRRPVRALPLAKSAMLQPRA